MAAKYTLAILAGAFLIAGTVRSTRSGIRHPQARTWLLIALIFASVSAWLFYRA